MEPRKYEVLRPVRYGGVLHRPSRRGSAPKVIEMAVEAAKGPLEYKAIRAAEPGAVVSVDADTSGDPVVTIGGLAALEMVAGLMDTLPSEDFEDGNAPSVEVLNARASSDMNGSVVISPALLDLAMAERKAKLQTPEPVVLSDAEQLTRITDAIKALDATGYERSGKPKVAAIRDELAKLAQPGEAEIEVRADRRDEVFASMVEAGFTIPVAT